MLERGTTVAGYRIDGLLGEGGMGAVYRATQLSLNRVVALKLLAAELSDDPDFRTRFQREGQQQAALDHQNIVTVYEAGQAEQGLFLAMRLIEGPTLKELILRHQLDARRSLRLLAQVAQALDEAHAAGLIHRDIKPQNILIGRGDHAYLADFGLTKGPSDASHLTGSGQFVGTIDYSAPEQIQGDQPTPATDCYALTAVLYECLTGRPPFPRATEAATIQAHLVEPAPRVTEHRSDLPAAIDEVIATGMAKDPARRPPSAAQLVRNAARALGSAPSPPVTPPAQPTRLSTAPPLPEDHQRTTLGTAGGVVVPAAPTVVPFPARPAPATHAPAARPQVPAAGPPASLPPAAGVVAERREPAERRGRLSPLVLAVIVVLAAVAAAAGFLVGHGGKKSASPSFADSASAGHLQLRYPSSWRLNAPLPAIPGIAFSDSVALGATGGGGGLTAGEVEDAGGPTLLPASFRRRVGANLPSRETVRLGTLDAYRYSAVAVAGLAGAVTLYVIPTSAGVATLACWSSPGALPSFAARCGQVAATVRLAGAQAYGLGPDPNYARSLSSIFARLDAAVSSAQAQAQAARTQSAQAAAEARLSAAYSAAAAALGQKASPPAAADAVSAIVAALKGLAAAYARAAGAARSGDNGGYRRAGAALGSASAALHAALQQLPAAGYALG